MFNVLSPDGDGWYEMYGVGLGGDVVLLVLSLVLSDDESCGAGAGEEGDDGRANRHDEIPDECLHVCAHNLHCF